MPFHILHAKFSLSSRPVSILIGHCFLQLLRLRHQFRDALKQSSRRAAVNHAVIEAQRQVRLHDRHELAFGFVPERRAPTGTEAEHERLFRQRKSARNQIRPNVPKFVTVAIEPPVASAGNLRSRASSTSSLQRCVQSFSDFPSALRMTGTSTPSSASTAKPTSMEDG